MSFFENIIRCNNPIKKFYSRSNFKTNESADNSIYDNNINNKMTKCYNDLSEDVLLEETTDIIEKLETIFGTKCI